MEYYTEVKLMGDAYGAGFSNGLTMVRKPVGGGLPQSRRYGPGCCVRR